MRVDVIRPSHSQKVPQVGRPQSEPENRARPVKVAPSGAADLAATSASGCRQTSVPIEAIAITA